MNTHQFSIDQLIDYVEKWLVAGEVRAEIFADNFIFPHFGKEMVKLSF